MLDTVSETASEAWSTDVAASDSERLIEVETDDTLSITTARYVLLASTLSEINMIKQSIFIDLRFTSLFTKWTDRI